MAPKYYENIDRVKDSVTMPELVTRYGFEPNRAGYICCPFHGEKTASMKIWDDHFKCFGCGAHGDIISFVMKYNNSGFNEAVAEINREFQLGLPFGETVSLREIRRRDRELARRAAEKREAERIESQRKALLSLWAYYDGYINRHPIPDNEATMRAYSDRDYLAYLIDNFKENEGYPDDILQSHRTISGRCQQVAI